ncbi:MAG: hypothetical protein IT373_14760, partial [Polyangiaceae bacterium]|nr:hypothetical protein [Polyangiaceae bacterium]
MALGLALVAPCLASGLAQAGDPPRGLDEAAAEVLRRGDHQTELGTEDGALAWPGDTRGGEGLPVGVGVGGSRSKPGQKAREPGEARREPAERPSAREPAERPSPSAREPTAKRQPPDKDPDAEEDSRRAHEPERDSEPAPPEKPARDPAGREASGARTVAVTLFALLGGVLGVALASALWQGWRRRQKPIPTAVASGELAAVGGTTEAEAALDPIEALAQAGQFAEAVHALLRAATARLSATERL